MERELLEGFARLHKLEMRATRRPAKTAASPA
jgi:hypothetical protein